MKICDKILISDSVTVSGTTLLIDIPANVFRNCEKYYLVIAQPIPDTATINMPVELTIGGVTTTTYPLVTCSCGNVTASMIRTYNKYPIQIATTATGANIKVLDGLACAPSNAVNVIPVE